MTCLVACLSSGKGTWTPVLHLAKNPAFERIYLICNIWTQQNFKTQQPNLHLVVIDEKKPLPDLVEHLQNCLKEEIHDTEVALNLYSGTGKEHMAVLSALLHLGLGIRLVTLENEQLQEL